MEIRLNLINHSRDVANSSYVIFQKNVAENFGELAVAWLVVKNLSISANHPFVYPLGFKVSAGDAWGNYTPQLDATDGQVFEMRRSSSGDVLQLSGTPASSPTEVELHNVLPEGGISANVYRDGRVVASKTNISPGQKAVFEFKPRIFIGAVSHIEEGTAMRSAVLKTINTEIDLLGISSADIVITGGGGGPNATPFEFTLTNVK